jgi:lysozyme
MHNASLVYSYPHRNALMLALAADEFGQGVGPNDRLSLSKRGMEALVEHEALADGVYNDSAGKGTFGVGHLLDQEWQWPSFLFLAARAQPARWSAYRKRVKGTPYLERRVVNDPGFGALVELGITIAERHVAQRRYAGRTFASLGPSQQLDVRLAARSAVRVEVEILSRDPLVLLRDDLKSRESTVRASVSTPLTQGEFDALVSFVFNVGQGRFRRSSVLRLINEGRFRNGTVAERTASIAAIEAAIRSYNIADGKVSEGLVRRRAAESNAFLADARAQLVELRGTR